jgi:hypothetical protein
MKSKLRLTAVAIAFAAFAGCGGAQPIGQQTLSTLENNGDLSTPLPRYAPALQQSNRALSLGTQGRDGLLYVGVNDTIEIFPLTGPNKKEAGSISNGLNAPWGLSVDSNRTLYVANSGNGTVTVYPYGSSAPSMTYSNGVHEPLYALADGAGHLYVSGRDPAHHNRRRVVEYAIGANALIKSTLLGSEADGMTLDAQGNLYVAYRHLGTNCSIAEFGPGLTNKKLLGMVIQKPQGLVIDSSGNLVVVESVLDNIDVFQPGATTPSVTVTISGADHLAELAMQSNETTLWVSTEDGKVYSMPYPLTSSTVPTQYEVTSALSNGIAVSNPK